MNYTWEKQILLPGLLLSVAALGGLFLLQMGWMNKSLWSENMRYRREAVESVDRIARFTLDNLDFNSLLSPDPSAALEEWRLNSSFPFLIKEMILPVDNNPAILADRLQERDVFLISKPDQPMFILDGTLLYESILLDNLQEYAGDYQYTLSFKLEGINHLSDRKLDWNERKEESVFTFNLPRFIELNGNRGGNLILNPGFDSDLIIRRFPGGEVDESMSFTIPYISIDLNDSRGSESFIIRLKRLNTGLIVLLSLILLGSYSLLYRLYREEEKQRKAGQTFVASVSHELRTPIAVIKTASENLSRGVVEEADRVRSYGTLMEKEADRLNRMVESILYYSRLEGGEGLIKPQWKETNLQEFTNEILSSLELAYPDRLFVKELAGIPERVFLDQQAYRMIVENLVRNALTHGRQSSVRIRLISDFPSRWRLVVEDDGPGIPKKEQKEIFEPFVRGSLPMTNQIKGSGLGLHLVRMAARTMGGTVKLESPYEFPAGIHREGCRFQLILPVRKEFNQ